MKIEWEIEQLKNAILSAERITGKNLTLPVLNAVLLEAVGKSLKIKATNLSLGVEIEIPAKVEKSGTLAVSGSVMAGVFVNLSQKENVFLEEENGNLLIKTSKSKIKIKGQNKEDFPTIPIVSGSVFNIGAKKFLDGIKSVYYSASSSDIKPEISSVYLYSNDDNLFFVSTDSFRLAEKKIKMKGLEDFNGVLIPFKNINEILKIFNDHNDDLKVCFNKNQISISSEGVYLTSRLVDGIFPDYRQIIPRDKKTEVVVLKQDIINALKIATVFSDKFNQVNLSIKPKEKSFELYSVNNDVGENKTKLDATLEGENVELGFNYKYFFDSLQSIVSDSVLIKINQSSKPMVVSGVSDSSFVYLIMPMNQ